LAIRDACKRVAKAAAAWRLRHDGAMRVVRIAGLVFALAACAWYALGVRQARDTGRAAAIVSVATPLTAEQVSKASSLISAAKVLNPDSTPDVLQAQLERDQGQFAQARATLERVVAREPDNAVAWLWLAKSSPGMPKTAIGALLQIRRLVPAVPPPP
jgi:Flp pilus assembly protein TadD